MNGPPLVVYGSLRRWSPPYFRATLQGYFLPASIIVMIGYSLSGLWTVEVTSYYLYSLPAAINAIFLGRAVNLRFEAESFLKYIHLILIFIGCILLLQT